MKVGVLNACSFLHRTPEKSFLGAAASVGCVVLRWSAATPCNPLIISPMAEGLLTPESEEPGETSTGNAS